MRDKRFPRAIAMIMVFVLSCSSLFAHKRTVSRIISDQHGAPVVGATIKVKGEKTATATDANGAFKIEVPSTSSLLLVSYVGAKTMEVATDGKTTVLVSLPIADTKLSEVVVIGYGTTKKANVSSAISSINA